MSFGILNAATTRPPLATFDITSVRAGGFTNGHPTHVNRHHRARETGTGDGYFPSHYCGRGAHGQVVGDVISTLALAPSKAVPPLKRTTLLVPKPTSPLTFTWKSSAPAGSASSIPMVGAVSILIAVNVVPGAFVNVVGGCIIYCHGNGSAADLHLVGEVRDPVGQGDFKESALADRLGTEGHRPGDLEWHSCLEAVGVFDPHLPLILRTAEHQVLGANHVVENAPPDTVASFWDSVRCRSWRPGWTEASPPPQALRRRQRMGCHRWCTPLGPHGIRQRC